MKFTALIALGLSAATSTLAAPAPAEERQLICRDVYVYFARGTTELGTLGAVVGPGLATAVPVAVIGKTVEVEGIPYPALVSGYLAGGDRGGARTMANRVRETASRCPDAKIFISGYSQGAQVTHLAARQLSSSEQARVTGVVTFGDPYRDTALPGSLQSRRRTYCNFGDLICEGLPTILAPHLTYGTDVASAAAWIADRV